MKKLTKKKVTSALAGVAAVAALVCIIFLGERNNDQYSEPSQKDTRPTLFDPSSDPTDTPIPTIDIGGDDNTYDPVVIGDDVKISINPAIKNAEIDRSPDVTPDHPEYIESYLGGGSFSGREGKVYKNDRSVSIDVQNSQTGEWTTYSFGLSLGEYNRFLYLNPIRNSGNPDIKGYFRFFASRGLFLDLSQSYDNKKEMLASHDNFTVRRAMDQLAVADYTSPMYPGAAWFTSGPLDEPVYIDTICYHGQGSIAAILRIWIDKDENGCYYIATIENRNLYLKNDPIFTASEIYYIYEMADADIVDNDLTGLRVTDKDWKVEDYYYDYRKAGSGPYYQYFLPAGKAAAAASKKYRDNDIFAVTLRYNGVTHSITLYYRIIAMPYEGNHGVYKYLGRDYHYNASISELRDMGYPGYD